MDITEVPTDQGSKKKKKSMKAKTKVKNMEVKEESSATENQADPTTAFPPTFSVSEIKNKQRRHLMFMKFKQEKRKVNRASRVKLSSILQKS